MLLGDKFSYIVDCLCCRRAAPETVEQYLEVLNKTRISALTAVHINNCTYCKRNLDHQKPFREIGDCQDVVIYSLAVGLCKLATNTGRPVQLKVSSNSGHHSVGKTNIGEMARHVLEDISAKVYEGTLHICF